MTRFSLAKEADGGGDFFPREEEGPKTRIGHAGRIEARDRGAGDTQDEQQQAAGGGPTGHQLSSTTTQLRRTGHQASPASSRWQRHLRANQQRSNDHQPFGAERANKCARASPLVEAAARQPAPLTIK